MNRVVKVSISNCAFTLAEEAFVTLKTYLDKLRNYYIGQEGGKEIVDDIEERIAELLNERTSLGTRVVSKADVDEVLEIMGTPEMIEDEDPVGKNASQGAPAYAEKLRKDLYRDADHRIFGGVCSGLAAYWNWDVALVRLLFVAVTLCSGAFLHVALVSHGVFAGWTVLTYIIMWICIPKAVTVEEKCAMRGAPVTAKDIEHQAQASYRGGKTQRYNVEKRQSEGSQILKVIVRVFAILFGAIFILIGTSVLVALIAAFCGVGIALGSILPTGLLSLVSFAGNAFLLKILLILVAGLPIIGILYLGCRMLFHLRGHAWIGLTMFLVWLASLIGLTIVSARGFKNLSREGDFEECIDITLPSDTLFIDLVGPTSMPEDLYFIETDASEYKLGWIDGENKDVEVVIFPEVNLIRQSTDEQSQMKIISHAFANRFSTAQIKAENNKPECELTGNVLTIKAQTASKEEKWKEAYGSVELYVPSDQTVIVRKPVKHEFGQTPPKSVHRLGGWWSDDRHDWDNDFDVDWDWNWD